MSKFPYTFSKKTFYLESLGCAKNQVDSEDVIAQFLEAGWEWVDTPEEAELIFVNTCGFIQSAREEAVNTLFEMKAAFPETVLICGGCFSQRYFHQLVDSFEEVDGFVGNRDLIDIPHRIEQMFASSSRWDQSSFGEGVDSISCCSELFRSKRFTPKGVAYVKIAEGCNHGCSYCAIPLIRGCLQSRPIDTIVKEVKYLVQEGVREIILVAQDLFAYGKEWEKGFDSAKTPFLQLLEALFQLPDDFYIRLLYMHPDDFDLDLISLMQKEKRLLPYLDIPFQHASKAILSRMNRKGDFETYLNLIKKIRKKIPAITIRSTFMLGHPGETSSTLEELLRFIEEASLDWVGFFCYSREEDTPSFQMVNGFQQRTNTKLAKKWQSRLEQCQQAITEKRLDRYVGQELKLLVEEKVQGEALYFTRSAFQAPEVDGLVVLRAEGAPLGEFVQAKIIHRNGVDLEAVLC